MAEQTTMGVAFVDLLCPRLRQTTDQLEMAALYRLDVRLARFLLTLTRQFKSDEKGGQKENSQEVHLVLHLNQFEIADVIGVTRSKVNRAFSELEAAGAIERQSVEIICRLSKLEDIASGTSLSA